MPRATNKDSINNDVPTVADFKSEVVQLGIELTKKVREGTEPKKYEAIAAIRDLLEIVQK